MSKPRVAILGASGIGKFHAREFKKAGADVVAILGSSEDSVFETSKMLLDKFNIESKPYSNLDNLLKNEKIDAVSVCVPSQLHFEYSMQCLKSGVNVFSEKPVVLNSDFNNAKFAKELVETAKNNNLVFTVNTQWPAVLEFIKP
jgi:predicted dehydrogenase